MCALMGDMVWESWSRTIWWKDSFLLCIVFAPLWNQLALFVWIYFWALTLVCNRATNTSDKVVILWLNRLNGLNYRKLFLVRIPGQNYFWSEMTTFIGWCLLWSLLRVYRGCFWCLCVARGSNVEWDTARDCEVITGEAIEFSQECVAAAACGVIVLDWLATNSNHFVGERRRWHLL